jgi:NAD(P)-dependent dehydrogenase (short-subunit alcohol dehydrogenase family)
MTNLSPAPTRSTNAPHGQPVALVTGASSGIGLAIAGQLIADGYLVFAGARRLDRMAGLATRGARLLPLDVTDDASLEAAIATVTAEAGRLDALINNAGYGSYGSLEEVPIAEGRRQMEVNVIGLARLTQLALPMMRAQRKGRIVNISSMGGRISEPFGAWYHATKFAVEGLSDCLRMEVRQFGIDVIVIQPGAIRTEWSGIAQEGLLKLSGSGPYADMAAQHARFLDVGDSASASPPEIVAKTVSQALSARRPRTRYPTGANARTMLVARKLLPDRWFDRLMLGLSRRLGRTA